MHDRLRTCPAARSVSALAVCVLIVAGSAAPAQARDGAAGGSGTPAIAWDQFREGERRTKDGDFKGALAAYTGARAALTESLPLDRALVDSLALDLYNLAASFSSAADTDSSLQCFEQVFLLRSRAGSLRDAAFEQALKSGSDTLADYAVSIGRAASAVPVYRARLEIEPSNTSTRMKLASALLALGKFEAVRKESLEVRRLDPRSADSWATTARTDMAESRRMLEAGAQREARLRVEWATDDLEEALKLDRDNPSRLREYASAGSGLADLLDEEGDYTGGDAARARSLGALDDALRITSSAGGLRLDRALLLTKAGRPLEAADNLEKAIGALEHGGPPETLRAAKEALAGCLLLAASDALNEGRFSDAEGLLSRARPLDQKRRVEIDALAASTLSRRAVFEESVAASETAPAGIPKNGDSLLALSDLYFTYGRYDEARSALTRAADSEASRPSEVRLALRSFRMRPGMSEPARKAEIEVEGGRIPLLGPSEDAISEIRKPLAEVWRKASRKLGPLPPGETPAVKVYANQRAFRSNGPPRLGASTSGLWHRGSILLFVEPGRNAAAWGQVLAREIGAWAAERLSRGRAPTWVKEGVSHWLSDDAGPGDLELLRSEVAAGRWVPLGELDSALAQSWNDEARLPLLHAEARHLMSTLVAGVGDGAIRSFLLALAAGSGYGADRALVSSAKLDTASLERMALRALGQSPSAPAR